MEIGWDSEYFPVREMTLYVFWCLFLSRHAEVPSNCEWISGEQADKIQYQIAARVNT